MVLTSSLGGRIQAPIRQADLWLVSNLSALQGNPFRLLLERGLPVLVEKPMAHTLAAANAVGKVGPNLDILKPAQSTVLNTINNGCLPNPPKGSDQGCLGQGVMPAAVVQGQEFTADFRLTAASPRGSSQEELSLQLPVDSGGYRIAVGLKPTQDELNYNRRSTGRQ